MTPARRPVRFDSARNIDGGSLLESFLVSVVVAILVIRLYLSLTGYPQVGGGGLHIAHMLWGGLLMLAAIVLLLAFLGRRVKQIAAVLGGLGFGTFIDELGKFLTSDNDYFYRPTIGLIYMLLVALFLLFRQIERRREPSRQELLVNAADMIKEVILDGAQSAEVAQALALLERSKERSELAEAIREAILSASRVPDEAPPLPARLAQAARRAYDRLLEWPWFHRAIILVFTLNAVQTLLVAGAVVIAVGPAGLLAPDSRSFVTSGQLVASGAASAMTILGVVELVRSRLAAYRWFKRSVLVSIFLVQVFLFFQSQLAALGGLVVQLILLSGLNTIIRAEFNRRESAFVSQRRGSPG